MWLKALFLCQKFKFSRVIATYVGKMKILDYFMIAHGKENVRKGSFPMSKVLVFEGNSYVCWKNEDIRLFLDYFMIAHGKEMCLKALFLFQKF